MSVRILTLFGEELPSEPQKPQRSRKAADEPVAGQEPDAPAAAETDDSAADPGEPGPSPRTSAVRKNSRKKKVLPDPSGGISILNGWQPDKQYYTIGAVARLFGVNTSHIRFWTNEFSLRVRTTRKGDRLYAPEHIETLRNIYHLVKERGFTLSGAKAKLREKTPGVEKTATGPDLKNGLLHIRNGLAALQQRLS